MNFINLSITSLGFAHITFELLNKKQITYFTKPATMLLIIAWCYFISSKPIPVYNSWIIAGLIFSLFGDIFLMLPKERFIEGLSSFLIGHICYIVAFSQAGSLPPIWIWAVLGVVAIGLMSVLWKGLKKLKIPVILYMLVIIVMASLAIGMSRATQPLFNAKFAAAGALLFMFSDSCLALRKFYKPLPYSPVWVMGSYFTAQWLIASSVVN